MMAALHPPVWCSASEEPGLDGQNPDGDQRQPDRPAVSAAPILAPSYHVGRRVPSHHVLILDLILTLILLLSVLGLRRLLLIWCDPVFNLSSSRWLLDLDLNCGRMVLVYDSFQDDYFRQVWATCCS